MNARSITSATPSFLHSDRRLARLVAQPIVRFLHVEAAGGIVLVVATVAALVWANVWPGSYAAVWATEVRLSVGAYEFADDVGHIVNDLLMALFFFVVGMEIKREIVVGELRDRRAIALPAMAAIGGMVVPAALFAVINAGGAGADGWGVPMATDVAFALGVVALLGSRVPAAVKVLLLTLAIVDDIGAIAVIALFYTTDLEPRFLGYAVLITAVIAVLLRIDVSYGVIFVILGSALWLMVYESGVHATIAGVVAGLLAPARPRQDDLEAAEVVDVLENRDDLDVADVRMASWAIRSSVSVCDRLIDALHPWTSYVVIPLFALANAGIELRGEALTSPSAVFVGVFVGLVIGKFVGIAGFSWLAVRTGLGRLPDGVSWRHVLGVGAVAGIGFTVSLFITGLAFDRVGLQEDAKLGTLAASLVAAISGWAFFSRARGEGSVAVEDGVDLVAAVEGVDHPHRPGP